MRWIIWRCGLFATLALALAAQAGGAEENGEGLYFQHGDWELACDNSGTCRAASYQADEDEHAISVLLTRKAGPGQAVGGQLMIGEYGEEDAELIKALPNPIGLRMFINGKAYGAVSVKQETLEGELAPKQVSALVASLSRRSDIEFIAGETSWRLSDAGAAAALLKMDDFQGRIGTRGALARKGPLDESHVTPARPVPVVHAAKVLDRTTTPAAFGDLDATTLSAALAAAGGEDCDNLTEANPEDREFATARLDDKKLLVSVLCWRAAYNEGLGYWVINAKPPLDPVLVTASGSEYSDGEIGSQQKGRGLGDCWSSETWVWDGSRFVHAASSSTGMCRLLAPGGAWALPTIVTTVN